MLAASGNPPVAMAEAFIEALEKNIMEIRRGNTEAIYQVFRTSPAQALQVMQSSRKRTALQNS